MDINESIQRMNQITNKWARTLDPIISVQNQIARSMAPIVEYQNQIAQSMAPIVEYQNRISQMLKNTYNLSSYMDSVSLSFNSSMQNLISYQQDILDTISKLDFDISSSYLSTESSIEFSQIVSDVLDEFNDMEIAEFTDSSQEISTCTSSTTTLNWGQILDIIMAILTLISIIQAQLPNPQLTNIEHAFYQLIEIEKQQLNLLEELRNE